MASVILKADIQPWVSKYRPKTIHDIVHQEEVTRTLNEAILSTHLPHLLFYGPPGTGKTSAILATAYQLYGPDTLDNPTFQSCVLELNASDERGIDVIRKKIKKFAGNTVASTMTRDVPSKYPCPPYKIIILDEADSMTIDAQQALRRIMEIYSSTTRFCLICNHVSRIIDPLISRTAKFRFKPLAFEASMQKLTDIILQEKLTCDVSVLERLIHASAGDMRRAITTLQSAFRLYGNALQPEHIDALMGCVPESRLVHLVSRCLHTKAFKEIQDLCTDLIADGFSIHFLLDQLHDVILNHAQMSDAQKNLIFVSLSRADKHVIEGADAYMQLLQVASDIRQSQFDATKSVV